jgi:hypothetical protein
VYRSLRSIEDCHDLAESRLVRPSSARFSSRRDCRLTADQIQNPMPCCRVGDRSIVCAGATGARVGSIAARCETSRSRVAASCALSSTRSLLDDAGRFEPVKCYALVHSYCTHLLNAGTDDLSLVQEARGHRDIRTTQVCTVMKLNPRLFRAVEKAFGRKS